MRTYLWFWSNAADLDEAEAQIEESINSLSLLVESCSKTNGIDDRVSKQLCLQRLVLSCIVTRCQPALKQSDRQLLSLLRIQECVQKGHSDPSVDSGPRVEVVDYEEGGSEDEEGVGC